MSNELAFNAPETHIISWSLWTCIRSLHLRTRYIHIETHIYRCDWLLKFSLKSTLRSVSCVCACPYSTADISSRDVIPLHDNTFGLACTSATTCASVFVQANGRSLTRSFMMKCIFHFHVVVVVVAVVCWFSFFLPSSSTLLLSSQIKKT